MAALAPLNAIQNATDGVGAVASTESKKLNSLESALISVTRQRYSIHLPARAACCMLGKCRSLHLYNGYCVFIAFSNGRANNDAVLTSEI
jgi:hypothetical protein